MYINLNVKTPEKRIIKYRCWCDDERGIDDVWVLDPFNGYTENYGSWVPEENDDRKEWDCKISDEDWEFFAAGESIPLYKLCDENMIKQMKKYLKEEEELHMKTEIFYEDIFGRKYSKEIILDEENMKRLVKEYEDAQK